MAQITLSPFWQKKMETPASPEIFRSRLPAIHDFALRGGFSKVERDIIDRESAVIAASDELATLFSTVLTVFKGEEKAHFMDEAPWASTLYDLLFFEASFCDLHDMYQKNGWTEEMFEGVLRDIKLWADHCLTNELQFGISRKLCGEIGWLYAQYTGDVIRFGRLQCNSSGSFPGGHMILGNKHDQSWIVVMCKEHFLTEKGLIAYGDEVPSASVCRAMTETEDAYYARLVRPDGTVDPARREFLKSDWEILAKEGDFSINLHIPADGPLTESECRKSMDRMVEFFHKQGIYPKAFICHSWILDPQFASILPADSNLLAFQKIGQIVTTPGGSEAYRRVLGFNLKAEDAHWLYKPSRMQQAFIKFLQNGGQFHSGAFCLPIR